ncbi:phosphotransferase family protein [Okibacterium endophyticum]
MFDDARDVLERVADAAGRELVDAVLSHAEPATAGYMLGYDVVLAGGEKHKKARIYIDTTPAEDPDDHTGPGERAGRTDDERTTPADPQVQAEPQTDEGLNTVISLRHPETGERITAWVHPYDPALPALATAAFPDAARRSVASFGIEMTGGLDMLAYRPGKRAVLRFGTAEGPLYLKVVRPRRAEALHSAHRRFHEAGLPVPQSRGWSPAGLVVLDALRGVPASDRIVDVAAYTGFVDALKDLTLAIGAAPSGERARTSLLTRVDWYRERLAEVMPQHARRVATVAEASTVRFELAEQAPDVTIHGDLHLGQVFVDRGIPISVTGVLDIDTAGRGDRADDLGCLHAHLMVSAIANETAGEDERAMAYRCVASDVRSRWREFAPGDSGIVDRSDAVASVHLLAHAFGYAVREHNADGRRLAERFIGEAETIMADETGHGRRTGPACRRAG